MKLSELLNNYKYRYLHGSGIDIEINSICHDSRNAVDGSLFVCITGYKTDGHKYAVNAVEKGAVVVVCEKNILDTKVSGIHFKEIFKDTQIILVDNSRQALAHISAEFFDNPTKKIKLIGVTGTNGKTTTTYLLESIFKQYGKKTGVIGTIENRIGNRSIKTERTTPESYELSMIFCEMANENIDVAAMEVSSHSLYLHRVDYCDFDIAIFTNLTQEHLDFHGSIENYRDAKLKLFKMAKKSVINIDDKYGGFYKENAEGEVLTISIDKQSDLRAHDIVMSAGGVEFSVNIKGIKERFFVPIPGKFTVYNALGAIAACILSDVPAEIIKSGLANSKGVPGRAQPISGKNNVTVIVDYAHTPDGLLNILSSVKEFASKRIITVFGCGGDRDKQKRPQMGKVAAELSDICIITSDNPRNETPYNILLDIEKGVVDTDCQYEKIEDRKKAIYHAVNIAEEGDIIVIAGKGHENYQVFSDKTIHFDDVEIANEALSGIVK